jgi:hypothetical protein
MKIKRITIYLNEQIFLKASELTGIKDKSRLVHLGLKSLIVRESALCLAKLGGSEKNRFPIPRRRS